MYNCLYSLFLLFNLSPSCVLSVAQFMFLHFVPDIFSPFFLSFSLPWLDRDPWQSADDLSHSGGRKNVTNIHLKNDNANFIRSCIACISEFLNQLQLACLLNAGSDTTPVKWQDLNLLISTHIYIYNHSEKDIFSPNNMQHLSRKMLENFRKWYFSLLELWVNSASVGCKIAFDFSAGRLDWQLSHSQVRTYIST